MSETEATDTGSVNPTANLDGWLDKKLDAVEPAEPAPAATQPIEPVTPIEGDWWETGLANVGHGFLRGKKGADVENAFRSAESRLKLKESEAATLKRELETIRREQEADAAARRVYQQNTQPSQPVYDPSAEIEKQWFDNPRAAAQLLREQTLAEAKQIAAEEAARVRQETQAEQHQRQVFEAGGKAYDTAREALNLDPDTWNRKSRAVYLELTDKNSPYYEDGNNLFRPEKIASLYKELWGDPTPAQPQIVVKPAPVPQTPPGSKRAASGNVPNTNASPLTQERMNAIDRFASIGGVDPKALAERAARRGR